MRPPWHSHEEGFPGWSWVVTERLDSWFSNALNLLGGTLPMPVSKKQIESLQKKLIDVRSALDMLEFGESDKQEEWSEHVEHANNSLDEAIDALSEITQGE